MDTREIIDCGTWFEVWGYHGDRLFEAPTVEECEQWLADNEPDDEDLI